MALAARIWRRANLLHALTHGIFQLLDPFTAYRRNGHQWQLTARAEAFQPGQLFGIGTVDLRGNNNHRLLLKPRAPGFKLIHDYLEVLRGIGAAARVGDIDEVQKEPRTFDVAEKLRS